MSFDFYEYCSRAYLSLQIWRYGGENVGEDEQGNKYFCQRKGNSGRREKRWVVYAGESEPSRVPPLWHAWLHHQSDALPKEQDSLQKPWITDHEPNLTGTDRAYRPPGHVLRGGERAAATGDYEPWTPS